MRERVNGEGSRIREGERNKREGEKRYKDSQAENIKSEEILSAYKHAIHVKYKTQSIVVT